MKLVDSLVETAYKIMNSIVVPLRAPFLVRDIEKGLVFRNMQQTNSNSNSVPPENEEEEIEEIEYYYNNAGADDKNYMLPMVYNPLQMYPQQPYKPTLQSIVVVK